MSSPKELAPMTPRVSVIVPAYNQAQYLGLAIQSVFDQSCQDFELIVVDDGSTDSTPEVLAGMHDPRLRVIRQSNAGLSAARNTGLGASSAELVTFLDADDLFLPDKLAVLAAFLANHPDVDMVSGGVRIIDGEGHELTENRNKPDGLALTDILMGNPLPVGAVMLRRACLDRVGFFDETLRACEDWDLWLRLTLAGYRIGWTDQVVAGYRMHAGQMTRESARMRKAMLAVLDKFFAQPDLPEPVMGCRNRAYARVYLRAAARAYHSGEYDLAQHDLAEAARLDTSLTANGYRQLIEALQGWAYSPQSADPIAYLCSISQHLPSALRSLQPELRKAIGATVLASLFAAPPAAWQQRGQIFLKACRYDPRCLANRGAIRMVIGGSPQRKDRIAA